MKHLMTGALILSIITLKAQENKTEQENRPVTIRVKKVEVVNGFEKITDTTYTVKGPIKIDELDELVENAKKKEGPKKIVIITDEVHGDNVQEISKDQEMDEQVERALKAAGVDGQTLDIDKIMIVKDGVKIAGETSDQKKTKIVVIKTIKITEPTKEDEKLISKQTGITDNQLSVDQMKFYPNPGNGKFTLNFSLENKDNTEVNILNMEGKSVYKEIIKDFSGHYKKDIDISENPKGVYFIKISQANHSQVKKIVLE